MLSSSTGEFFKLVKINCHFISLLLWFNEMMLVSSVTLSFLFRESSPYQPLGQIAYLLDFSIMELFCLYIFSFSFQQIVQVYILPVVLWRMQILELSLLAM